MSVGKENAVFKSRSEARPVEIFPGVMRRTLTSGDRAMLTEISVPSGSGAALHSHPEDELGYVSTGRIRVRLGNETQDLGPGDSYCVAREEPHQLEALEDSVCVVAFAPVRAQYMD